MKVMVVGGGGREHAIIKKIKQSPLVEKIYALPGNGGMANDAECVAIGAKDIDKICELIPKDQQKIIFKMHIQGYSFVEIGKKVNLTNKQVNQLFQTVKKRLQRMDYAINNILR